MQVEEAKLHSLSPKTSQTSPVGSSTPFSQASCRAELRTAGLEGRKRIFGVYSPHVLLGQSSVPHHSIQPMDFCSTQGTGEPGLGAPRAPPSTNPAPSLWEICSMLRNGALQASLSPRGLIC